MHVSIHPSERIADGEMETKPVFKLRNVVVSALARVIRHMQGHTEVKA